MSTFIVGTAIESLVGGMKSVNHTLDQMLAIDEYLEHYLVRALATMRKFDQRSPHNRDEWSKKQYEHWKHASAGIKWVRGHNRQRIERERKRLDHVSAS
jgi:hypothetical protein